MGDLCWYRVSGTITISVYTDVLAHDEHGAAELADLNRAVGLYGGDSKKQWVTSGKLDGEPEPFAAEILRDMTPEEQRKYLGAAKRRVDG